jgi:hypothetical protein
MPTALQAYARQLHGADGTPAAGIMHRISLAAVQPSEFDLAPDLLFTNV